MAKSIETKIIEKKKMGAPTKLTPEVQKKICDAVIMGAYIETAAAYAGVSKAVLYDWLKRGNKQKRGHFRNFLDAIEKAFADSELRDLQTIDHSSVGKTAKFDEKGNQLASELQPDWRAAAWRLERKHPKKWGRKASLHFEDPDTDKKDSHFNEESVNAVIAHELDKMDDDQFED